MAGGLSTAPSIRSTVSWALLGIVIEAPGHGYELAVRFQHGYGDLVEVSSRSHIYAALDSLTRRGMIEAHPADVLDAGMHRHPKTRYEATRHGVENHRDWLVGALADGRKRARRFTIQLAALPHNAAHQVLDSCERQTLEYSTRPAPARPPKPQSDGAEQLAERLAAEQERLANHARLSWIDYARMQLDSR